MSIYLYVKTHQKTGLKYLGKTSREDYHEYPGSGLIWKRHLKKHGQDYSTEILLKTESIEEARETGIFFSRLFDVVNSTEWANLTVEDANGGENLKKLTRTPEWNKNISRSKLGKKNPNYKHGLSTNEIKKQKYEKSKQKRLEVEEKKNYVKKERHEFGMSGIRHREESKRKISEALKGKPSGASGKKWITDGINNKMIDANLEIPNGWKPGKK
jgi:hypothetical protein